MHSPALLLQVGSQDQREVRRLQRLPVLPMLVITPRTGSRPYTEGCHATSLPPAYAPLLLCCSHHRYLTPPPEVPSSYTQARLRHLAGPRRREARVDVTAGDAESRRARKEQLSTSCTLQSHPRPPPASSVSSSGTGLKGLLT